MAPVPFPRFAVLKSNKNSKRQCLRYDENSRRLVMDGDCWVGDHRAKFELEELKLHDKIFLHIRCCYNNKYLIVKSGEEKTKYIVAAADQKEEDQSKDSCTLFYPIGNIPGPYYFMHGKGHIAKCLDRDGKHYLIVNQGDGNDHGDVNFTFTNWETLVLLPKHVAFKGNNGKYLQRRSGNYDYMDFRGTELGEPNVGHEILPNLDGSVCIKHNASNRFWRLYDGKWILAESSGASDKNAFWPVKIGNNVIALRNLENNQFCKNLANSLAAVTPTITEDAILQVEELVVSRRVYGVDFRFDDAKIYGQTVITMDTAEVTNMTSSPMDKEVELSYKEFQSSKFDANLSLNVEQAELKAEIPVLKKLLNVGGRGEFQFSAEFNGSYSWGATMKTTKQFETTFRVTVQPMTKLTVYQLATQASFDIPFSYTQHDVLTNGEHLVNRMDDGIYTGINGLNFHMKAVEEELSPKCMTFISYAN